MKIYKVEVEWTTQGTMFITAKNKKEALRMIELEQFDDIMFEDRTSGYEVVGDIEEHKE